MQCERAGEDMVAARRIRDTYLENVVGELEDDDVLHAEVALNKVEPLGPARVDEAVRALVRETLSHEILEVLEEVDLSLELDRDRREGVRPADHRAGGSGGRIRDRRARGRGGRGRDVVEVSGSECRERRQVLLAEEKVPEHA